MFKYFHEPLQDKYCFLIFNFNSQLSLDIIEINYLKNNH